MAPTKDVRVGRKRSATLTDGELPLMRVLWDRGASTVSDVLESLAGPDGPAYNTVLTMLRILERKGYVRHQKDGRAFVFEPIVDQAHAQHSALWHLLDRFFDNSPASLVLNVLEDGDVPQDELKQLRDLIAGREAH